MVCALACMTYCSPGEADQAQGAAGAGVSRGSCEQPQGCISKATRALGPKGTLPTSCPFPPMN